MSAPKARVADYKMVVHPTRVSVMVVYVCPFCGEKHGAGWHSPTSEGGERNTPCTINPETGVGASVSLVWPGIPGVVSATLLEFRPDILGRSDLVADPRPNEGGRA